MWRGIIAPAGIEPSGVAFWERTLAAVAATDEWRAELAKKYWANTYLAGEKERAFLDRERAIMAGALADLGLLPA
jgi:putative tricarboxylic transport membrane protein